MALSLPWGGGQVYRVMLPGNAIIGEGKPENQNHASIFSRGELQQANQPGPAVCIVLCGGLRWLVPPIARGMNKLNCTTRRWRAASASNPSCRLLDLPGLDQYR